MVAERNPEIRKAVDTLYELSADEQVRAEYEMRQKAWRDRLSQNEGYYQEGWEEGREEGREVERKYVLELLAQGLSVEDVKQRLSSNEL